MTAPLKKHAQAVLRILRKSYPIRGPFVEWSNPLELVVGTVLSAQCTDKRVNLVTKNLFKKYRSAADYAAADLRVLEQDVRPTGFYKTKARYLKGIGERLVESYDGKVPDRLEDLLTLPGVSHKSANLIMAKAWGKPTGVAVDTHVSRVAPRLGWTTEKDPKKIERDLNALFPPKDYLEVNENLILHGRATCVPRKPRCPTCPVRHLCPSAKKFIREFWS